MGQTGIEKEISKILCSWKKLDNNLETSSKDSSSTSKELTQNKLTAPIVPQIKSSMYSKPLIIKDHQTLILFLGAKPTINNPK